MQTIIVDTTPGFRMPTINYSQGDIGRTFAIDLRSRFGDALPASPTITIQATKPSGLGFSVAATSISGAVATFTVTETMSNEAGRFPAELKIVKSGTTLFTANFYIECEVSAHPEGTTDGDLDSIMPKFMSVQTTTLPAGDSATYSFDPGTNTATFGIPKGADGSLASGVLAQTYSSSKTYAVGDYVYYNGNLYRCSTAITTAEAWTSGHWTQVALADDVSDLKADLTRAVGFETTSPITWVANSYVDNMTGVFTPYNGWHRSGYIEIGGNEGVIHFNNTANASSIYNCFYDENYAKVGANFDTNNKDVKIHSRAKYFAVSIESNKSVSFYKKVAPLTDRAEKVIVDELVADFNEFDNALIYDVDTEIPISKTAGILSTTGTVNTGDSAFAHYTVNVSEGQVYKVKTFEQSNTSYPFLLYYNASNVIVGYEDSGSAGLHTRQITIPSNVVKICVNGYDTQTTQTHIYLLEIVNSKEYVDDAVSNNYWKGKKIVWFGTSIPAGVVNAGDSGGNGAYPTRIGKMLGATVYNESVGSSKARAGDYHSITADDPMGYGGVGAIGLMLSLSLSSSEKQDIMDEWDSKWKNIVRDPSSYDPSEASTYLASSWDVKLTKYLTGGSVGQCDLYVFDHGYNDGVYSYGFSDLAEIPATEDDRTYFFGAMNFLVGKILADNPKAKIMIIGHYNYGADAFSRGSNYSGKYVCDAQKAYAESWGLPCIETWKLLGLSMNNIDVNGTPTPVIHARYPDWLHPASDTTGYELQRYAEALAPFFKVYN